MKRGLSDLATSDQATDKVAGLFTLLEKAQLQARHAEAAKCCTDLGLSQLDDLHLDSVREELSKSLRLKFVENEKLKAECADVSKLRAYAASDSGQSSGDGSDRALGSQPPDTGGTRTAVPAELAAELSTQAQQLIRLQDENRDLRRRLSTSPIVSPPTQALLHAGTSQSDVASPAAPDGIIGAIMTLTIVGSLEGPPPFDAAAADALVAKLAQTLEMHKQHLTVKKARSRKGHLHQWGRVRARSSLSTWTSRATCGTSRAHPEAQAVAARLPS